MSTITESQAEATAPRAVATSRRHNTAFWIVSYTFAVTLAFTSLPTPLYVLYQARDHFSTFMITVIFAAYAVGVVAGHALVIPYLVSEALMLAGAVALAFAPETAAVRRGPDRPAYHPQRVSVPDAQRRRYFATAGVDAGRRPRPRGRPHGGDPLRG
jgi:hypothetical protein